MADNKVNSGLLEFGENQKVFVALDAETSEVQKAVTIDGDGVETDIQGVQPSGKKEITTTEEVNVASYATAQVVDEDLVAGNIKKDVDILGVVGSYEPEAPASDFSTAKVTVNNNTEIAFEIELANYYDVENNEGIMTPSISSQDISESIILDVVLYKGKALCIIRPLELTSPTVSVSGNIQYDSIETYLVTGDGAITLTNNAE